MKFLMRCCASLIGAALILPASAQTDSAAPADSATFDSDGTAHVYRVVPMPSTVSPEAQAWLASLAKKKSQTRTLAERRIATDEWRKQDSAEARQLYPVNIEETSIAGVRTDLIWPLNTTEAERERVLINLHGGGFVSDSGSLIEGVPIANLARIKSFGLLPPRAGKSFSGGGR
jgi:epsilon-lactone hydrolase